VGEPEGEEDTDVHSVAVAHAEEVTDGEVEELAESEGVTVADAE